VFAATVIACSFAIAQPPGSLPAAETDALSKNVRTLVLLNLPDPIVQSSPGWGTMKETTVGVKYHRDGLKLWTEVLKGQKPDGTWRRIAVKAVNPQQTLALALKDVVSPEPGKLTFTAFIGVDCEIKFEQQLWNKGNRLYSGETRGRCHGALLLKCEATNRVEPKPGSFIPDLVLRMRVTEAQLFYEKLEITHTAGIGGDGAKLLGEAVIGTIRQVKPSLEKDLLAKANAAIVKAGDTKELRVELSKLMEGKAPTITKKK
jgi:hypothetical protein